MSNPVKITSAAVEITCYAPNGYYRSFYLEGNDYNEIRNSRKYKNYMINLPVAYTKNGFVTDEGNFVLPKAALKIANAAGQVFAEWVFINEMEYFIGDRNYLIPEDLE